MGSQALNGRFETDCIPLVAEFGTDHIEKAVFVTSASIFSETVGGMFGGMFLLCGRDRLPGKILANVWQE